MNSTRHNRLPPWFRRSFKPSDAHDTWKLLRRYSICTVCESAKCPNLKECFSSKTATFLVLGPVCTRNCGFCSVERGTPASADPTEPERLASAASEMGLSYVVLTMVTRDDLEDGGGRHVAAVIESLRRKIPEVRVEALVSDLGGSIDSLELLLASRPDVFNHNIETVPRLYPEVRSRASYTRSLALLERASSARPCLPVKSGFMVGLGETEEEIVSLMKDIRSTGCRILTIGQYLRPSNQNLAVKSFVSPEKFQEFEALGREMGFHIVYSGPLVRSSYLAAEAYEKLRKGGNC